MQQQQQYCPYAQPMACNPPYIVQAPCCPELAGIDVLGIGTNQQLLDYQFGSMQNAPVCGVSLTEQCKLIAENGFGAQAFPNCQACPCKSIGCNAFGQPEQLVALNGNDGCCDYLGLARDHASIFGPGAAGRSGLNRWG